LTLRSERFAAEEDASLGAVPGFCHHRGMDEDGAPIVSRAGNWAVVHMPGRRFPGIHVQGDTFAALREQLAGAARALRDEPCDPRALDEVDYVVDEMSAMLAFYEQALAERGIQRPY
jgi:hypothetical protein